MKASVRKLKRQLIEEANKRLLGEASLAPKCDDLYDPNGINSDLEEIYNEYKHLTKELKPTDINPETNLMYGKGVQPELNMNLRQPVFLGMVFSNERVINSELRNLKEKYPNLDVRRNYQVIEIRIKELVDNGCYGDL